MEFLTLSNSTSNLACLLSPRPFTRSRRMRSTNDTGKLVGRRYSCLGVRVGLGVGLGLGSVVEVEKWIRSWSVSYEHARKDRLAGPGDERGLRRRVD